MKKKKTKEKAKITLCLFHHSLFFTSHISFLHFFPIAPPSFVGDLSDLEIIFRNRRARINFQQATWN
jgi:hypothetical protein